MPRVNDPSTATASGGTPTDLFSQVVEAMTDGLAVFDEDAKLLRANAAFSRLNPAMKDVISPDMRWDIFLREAVARGVIATAACERLRWLEERLEAEDPPPQPLEIETHGGNVHEVSLRATAAGGFLFVQRDVTERRLLEANERSADLLLRKVLEACPANVVMSRIGDGYVIYRSPAAAELFGAGRNAHEYFASREERADFITALLPEGRVEDMPMTGVRPNGARFPALVSARIIDYRGEDVMVSSTVDISKEVALRRTLAEQREQLFQSEKMSALGELLAGVAHELNNPLSVVVGHALMMREEITDSEALRRIGKISDAAERCSRIVKSFLAMARQQPAKLSPVSLRPLFEAAIDALSQGPDGIATQVDLSFPDNLPHCAADEQQIAQVAINLLKNADQAIRETGKGDRITVRARHDTASGFIKVTVADNGPGVPPSIRNRIFDPLFTTKEIGRGTGIGLAFCHRVLSAHFGDIHLESPPSGGAAFVLRLPVAERASGNEVTAPQSQPTPHTGRVLIVDDEEEVTEYLREVLTKDGFAVDATAKAESALALALTQPYTLILTDINMPGMGGRGLYEAIRREAPEAARRIGFITGDTMSPQVRSFLDAARRPYLEKPVGPGDVRRLAREMLGQNTTTDSPS